MHDPGDYIVSVVSPLNSKLTDVFCWLDCVIWARVGCPALKSKLVPAKQSDGINTDMIINGFMVTPIAVLNIIDYPGLFPKPQNTKLEGSLPDYLPMPNLTPIPAQVNNFERHLARKSD